ncbi:MAG: oxygenase MpaB family protein [Bacteroidota bacterium]
MEKIQYYEDKFLDEMRQTMDPVADQVVAQIFKSGQAPALIQLMKALTFNSQPTPSQLPPEAEAYFQEQSQLPDWADLTLLQEGSQFFQKHAEQILSMLGFLSLPYCYAAADGAQVLYLSQQIKDNTRRRLLETGTFVVDVMDPQAFQKGGRGFISILKVRLMHAAVRFHILHSNKWNAAWGQPINQEDMAGTNGAFSWLSVRGLRKMGVFVSPSGIKAYYHLWNVIGFLMGVRPELLPDNSKEAYALDRKIAQRHFRTSEAGVKLTQSLLRLFRQEAGQPLPKGFPEAYMRFLLGDKVADILQVPPPNWTQNLVQSLRYFNNYRSAGLFPEVAPNQGSLQDQIKSEIDQNEVSFLMPLSL